MWKRRPGGLRRLGGWGPLLGLGGSGGSEEAEEARVAAMVERAEEERAASAKAAAAAKPAEPEEPEIKSIELIAQLLPKSNLAESYRTIRTSLLLSSANKKAKAIVVTSALPEEGKSVTLSNLAVTLAQAGKRVMIIDSDLRKPTQHKIFKIRNINGLTNYLTSDGEI